tara:strand:- start:243 stop:1490 length:1248 start_codon:yes stop_codon:yes gene_type:complete
MVDFSSIGRRVATQVVNNGLQKVAGNVKGLLSGGKKGSDSSDFRDLNTQGSDTKTFQFPLDVTQGPGLGNHGHYIMFFINEQKHAKLRFSGGVAQKNGEDLIAESIRRDTPAYINEMVSDVKSGTEKSVVSKVANTSAYFGGGLNTDLSNLSSYQSVNPLMGDIAQGLTPTQTEGDKVISIKRPATKRLDTAIALYMPNAINVTYGSRYLDTEISPLGAAAGDIGVDILEGRGSFKGALEKLQEKLPQEAKRRVITTALQLGDAVGLTGAREAFEINRAEVVADRMELAFKNVNRRNFQYSFKMIPKNEKEADEIRKIIYAFKFNMLPEMTSGRAGNTMGFPNTFDIEYRFLGKDNDYISRVSTCVLETMTVSYGGDRFKTFAPRDDGAPVVETSLTLSFKELELITRERVEEGY